MNSSVAFKVTERHSVLVDNIGTFAEEDNAYELLNSLSVSLPFFVIVTWVLDALLAAVYLKFFHPWRILLQEVSSLGFQFRHFKFFLKGKSYSMRKSSQDFPLLGGSSGQKVDVEMEVCSCHTSYHQVVFSSKFFAHYWC